ncbi:hypothetical protein HDV57DRAFT_196349 [Trichoderma longibrachiatum]|uniref:Uncharacterized protein n=1 Tax=Trichoderma longibrachiatum ATCC 18648 TaxID=983965 RepID=A0A2T4C8P7_TRILO|nr:hypothetical protein M440DRAFT_1400840 [Trichoderma longibrachiatum ATCC 18648]
MAPTMPRFCRSLPDFSYYQIFAPSPLDYPQTLRCPTAVAPPCNSVCTMPCPTLPIFFLAPAASCSASSNMLALARQERARSRAMDTLCYDALPLQNKVATGSPFPGEVRVPSPATGVGRVRAPTPKRPLR